MNFLKEASLTLDRFNERSNTIKVMFTLAVLASIIFSYYVWFPMMPSISECFKWQLDIIVNVISFVGGIWKG